MVRPLWRLFGLFAVNLFSSGVRLLTDTLLRRRLVALLFHFVFLVSGRVSLCVCHNRCVYLVTAAARSWREIQKKLKA